MDFATAALAEVAKDVIVRPLHYLTQHEQILSILKEKLDRLIFLQQSIQLMVDMEMRKGNVIIAQVQFWLSHVDEIVNELQRWFYADVGVAKKKTCFGGQCPNLAIKYSLSKQAAKEIRKILLLIDTGNRFPTVSYREAPIFTQDIKIPESRKKYITKLIEYLKDDQLKRISIYGLGGVGKTTLVKTLIRIWGLFDIVVMVAVSANPNYMNIQAQIADCLGFTFESETLKGRSMELNEWLKEINDNKLKVLIVLDDVWQKLDFESIGLPSPDRQKGIKILFTSRRIDVCQSMGSQKNISVSPLPEGEAWDLFREMVGDVVDIPGINPIAKEVVKKLNGIPLLIIVKGRELSHEENEVVWKDVLEKLKPEDMELDRYSRTKISLISLDNVHKSCLLLCSLFPKDLDIPVESLLRQGVGLGLFEATEAVWKERNRVNELVNNLKRCSLLLDSEQPGCVKMHDVVRGDVLKTENWISDTELKLLNLKQKEGKWLRMLLILDSKIELVESDDPECPTLELIQVWSQSKKELIIARPENLIHGMSKLKVLVMKNLRIPKEASSLFYSSVNLHSLQLEGCDLGDISVIGKEFNNLEILSFANSNIKELPTEIGNLGSLRILDLTGCDGLTFISANVFARLSRLEELYFRVKKFPWMLNKDFVQELRNLFQQLTVLEIKVRKVDILTNDFIFGNLQKFWVSAVPYSTSYEPPREYPESNILHLRVAYSESIKSSLMTMQLVEKCEILILEKVWDLKNVINELDAGATGLKNVKDLRLHSCPSIECVIDCTAPSCALPLINSLSLENLTNLSEILHASNHHEIKKSMIGFSDLEQLELKLLPNFIGFSNAIVVNDPDQPIGQESSSATKITNSTNKEPPSSISAKLFSSNWMKQFPHLKTLLLKHCTSLEMVFDLKGFSESTGLALDLLFPQLRKIEISFLQKLSFVWGNVDQYRAQGFQNLKVLTISNCDSLKYVFTSVIARGIENLEELKVSTCKLIKNIIVWSRDDEGDNNKGQMQNIEFKKLKYLSLSRLPKLVSMSSGSHGLEYPFLRKFEIEDCPMLEISSLPIPTHKDAMEDTLTEDDSLNENNSRTSSTLALGCFPFQPKLIREGNSDKKIRKEASLRLARDHVPSTFGMKSRQEIVSMPVLEDLCVIKCDLPEVLFSGEENYSLTHPSYLKTIKIENCDKLKTIMASRDKREDMINLFAELKSLHLKELPNVESFYFFGSNESRDKQQSTEECVGDRLRITCQPFINECLFPKLTSLVIETCNKVIILLSHSCLSSLEHLEKLEVQHCENVEAIIPPEDKEASADKIMFPELQHLLLRGLPKLKAVNLSSRNCHFPSLQKVEIEDCPNLMAFSRGFCVAPNLEDVTIQNNKSLISHYTQRNDMNAIVQGFQEFVASQGSDKLNWTKLHNKGYFIKNSKTDIEAFDQLSVLIPFDEMPKLQEHVRELNVRNCGSLVEVFESQVRGGAKEGENPTHHQLQVMPKLTDGWKLTSLSIEHCHSLESLFSHSNAKSLVQLQQLRVVSCNKMVEIVTLRGEGQFFDKLNKVKIAFPNLQRLILEDMPMLGCFCSEFGKEKEIMFEVMGDKFDMDEILFPKLHDLNLKKLPKLKYFYPCEYVIASTPNLSGTWWDDTYFHTNGDLNLTIHYIQNSEMYKVELQKLETFRGIERDDRLVGYIKTIAKLDLENCRMLLNCIPSNVMHLFSHLRCLTAQGCNRLKDIFEPNDQILGFQNLQRIIVKQCHDLKYVFPNVSMATSLPCLVELEVYNCDQLQEIIGNNEQEQQQTKVIVFASLIKIELGKLPSLKCFCRSSFPCYVEMPNCSEIGIKFCPEMETFWHNGTLYAPFLEHFHVENTEIDGDEEVNEAMKLLLSSTRYLAPE